MFSLLVFPVLSSKNIVSKRSQIHGLWPLTCRSFFQHSVPALKNWEKPVTHNLKNFFHNNSRKLLQQNTIFFFLLLSSSQPIFSIAGAGGLSANGNMFGNFARWNEPSRDSGGSQGPGPGNPGNPGYPGSGLMSSSQSKKADYKVVNASPDFESSSSQRYPSSLVFECSMEILGCLFLNLKNNHTIGHLRVKCIRPKFTLP